MLDQKNGRKHMKKLRNRKRGLTVSIRNGNSKKVNQFNFLEYIQMLMCVCRRVRGCV